MPARDANSDPQQPSVSLRERRRPSTASSASASRVFSSAADSLLEGAKDVEHRIEEALLVLWDELPHWRRDNHFIHSGYRRTSNSFQKSFWSIFYLHNEFVNIWTHLLGAISFTFGGFFLYNAVAPRYESASESDVLVFTCFFLGAFCCLGMSATYHTLSNHSPEVAKWGNKLDYTGIVFLIVGSYVPTMYYGFFCYPALLTFYLSMIFLLGLGCIIISWFEQFRTPAWRPYRAMMFVGLGASGVVPILHALTFTSFTQLDELMGLRWVMLQGAMYIFGALLYAVRWPECWYPGRFDIWGSSHQIFHVFVVLAAATHLHGMAKAFDYHHAVLGGTC
ncbi:hemolysin-III related domain-containing protein [Neurospora intermedia]|uniref:Hemolysin-III related domain-containing protein n=1 Tax=Neurospora intermedia TaxID=5142 RepID=A0ABR3DIZ9_NEUIN